MNNNPYSGQFDCIKHINTLFPNEQSLENIDTEISKLQGELKTLQDELQVDIHEHAVMQNQIWEDVKNVDTLAKDIFTEIQDIKVKAQQSEELVYQMCKDIKSLDIAKRNLTFSIAALKKFIMMLQAIEKLKESCANKKYKDVGMLLEAFHELSTYFQKFQNIPQIVEVTNEREKIVKELKLQLIDDYILFGKGNSLMTPSELQEACSTVEHLGLKFKDELVTKICKFIIGPYQELFQQPENKNLETTERRYAWIARAIKEFESKFPGIFPEYWAVQSHIYYEFCAVTRLQLADILESKQEIQDVAILMKGLSSTLKFETKLVDDLKKKYEHWLNLEKRSDFMIEALPRLKGSISNIFEPYLRPYIVHEESELMKQIDKLIQADKADQEAEIKIFNSSLQLFGYVKNLLKRSSQYSRSQVMFDIQKLIKKGLKKYADDLLVKVMNSRVNEHVFQIISCFCINTAEYCKEVIPQLQEEMVQLLDAPFSDQVDLTNEEEQYNQTMNKTVEAMIQFVDSKLDICFQTMLKENWEQFSDMQDSSKYVKEIIQILEIHIKSIKDILSETYLIFYLNKLVVYLNSKFINSVFRIKKISEVGLQQLGLDVSELRGNLQRISKLKQESKSQASFVNFVQKTFQRSDTILKLVQMTLDKFVENFQDYAKKYSQESVVSDLDKILTLKGLKRQDVPQLNKFFIK